MKATRRMWISAAVVGVVLAGGASVAATAATDQAGRLGRQPGAEPSSGPADRPRQSPPAGEDGSFIVSRELNADPERVGKFWTPERMEGAEPLPMPAVSDGRLIED